jgi:hypothetical protein
MVPPSVRPRKVHCHRARPSGRIVNPMSPRAAQTVAAFRELQRRLTRRRIEQIDLRLRLELLALAAVGGGFLFWQVRVPLDGIARREGPLAAARATAVALAGAVAALRHARLLRRAPGPAWLALPLPPGTVARHLAWESRRAALWLLPAALAVLLAAAGLVPAWANMLLAAGFVGLLLATARISTALAAAVVARGSEPRPGLDPLTRTLATAARPERAPRVGPARWRRAPAWFALMAKDSRITLRPSAPRARAVAPLVFAALSAGVRWLPAGTPADRHALAFALALAAAATFAEWIVAVSGSDPFTVLRGLPLGAAAVWGARAAWALLAAMVLVSLQAATACGLSAPALRLFLAWTGLAAFGIGALGANYAVTLFPRADVAARQLTLSLAFALAASFILPLSGWVVLLTAFLHSGRRLPRWAWLEEA